MSQSVYEIITDRIIQQLEKGVAPWRKPWSGGAHFGQSANLISKRPYRGVNAVLTNCQGFASPYWVTFKQAKELGGHVKAGERGTPIVYLGKSEKEKADGSRSQFAFLRYYTAFNLDQCEGIKVPVVDTPAPSEFRPIESAEAIAKASPMQVRVIHERPSAFYVPALDYINMPKPESFAQAEEYYSTLFHEMTHATGHASRLARGVENPAAFGSPDYSREELVAEMGAAFLCGHAGIETATIQNSASYLQGWIKALKGDSRLIIQAAAAGQKAADYIMGRKPETTKEEEH